MPKRKKPENNKPSIRNMQVYKAVCDGKLTQTAIAKQFGVSQQRVSIIAQDVEDWHRPQFEGEVLAIKRTQTRLLMRSFMEAMEAWEKSKEDATMRRVKSSEDGFEKTREKRGQCGNASYLSEARACLADIRKIWGADAPIETRDVSKIADPRVLVERVNERLSAIRQGLTLPLEN